MRVLVTGAFGNLGVATLDELLAAGHEVRGFDLDSKRARRAAAWFQGRVETSWGDVTRPDDVARAVAGCDAVIHDAALLPPASEGDEELTRRVNVDGTRNVIDACKARPEPPRLVFASSVSLFGPSGGREPPARADDPILPTDAYTRSKAACEGLLRESSLDWVILRFGAVLPPRPSADLSLDLREFFSIAPETRVEYVHPRDAGLAQVRAVEEASAGRKVLLIGGGEGCRITMGELNDAFLEASGIGRFPREAYGDGSFYTDWMDTEESQGLLGFQRHGFAGYAREVHRTLRWRRRAVLPLRGPIRWWMLRSSRLGGG